MVARPQDTHQSRRRARPGVPSVNRSVGAIGRECVSSRTQRRAYSSRSAYFVTSPQVRREYIDLQLNAVRVTPPVSHMAAALIPAFGRLYGTLNASCATDHDGLLKAPGRMTVSRADF